MISQNQKPTRRELLAFAGTLAGTALLPKPILAQHGPDGKPLKSPLPTFDNDPIKVTKLTDNLFLLAGVGGNIVLLTGAQGAILVDTGVPTRGKDLQKIIKTLNKTPVATVINTHFHFDHTGGNEAFGLEKAVIVAQETTRERLSSSQTLELIGFTVPASPPAALPALTFENKLTLHRNNTTLLLTHVPPAHTDTDVFIQFKAENIIHAGDLFFNGFYPFIDYSSKGWIGGMIAAMDTVLAAANNKTVIVPGHGPLGDYAQLLEARTMLATVQSRIEPLVKSGKTVDEIVAAKPTADLDDKWGKGALNPESFVKDVATSLIRHNTQG